MVQAQQTGASFLPPAFGSVTNPVAMMMHEHTLEGERFEKMQQLSNDFTVPADGCNTYRVTYGLLKEFRDDLHLHIHLENNILFPKAVLLEESLANAAPQSCSVRR
jgi:regulator of cell morphogenesis and NO signaling